MHPKLQANMRRDGAIYANAQRSLPHAMRRSFGENTFQPAMTSARRDINKIGGYKEALTFDDHYTAYTRTFGGAAIKLLPNKAFSQGFIIKDGDSDGKTTKFEKDCVRLCDEFELKKVMRDLTEFSRVFTYGGVIISARESDNDGNKQMNMPISGLNGIDSIVKFDVVMQDQISAEGCDTIKDTNSKLYGLPEYYQYDERALSNQDNENAESYQMHRSRVFAFSETAPVNKLEGIPFNEQGYNYIQNCEKVTAAAPEGFIKNARAPIFFDVENAALANYLETQEGKDKFNDKVNDFNSGINTSLVNAGLKANVQQVNIADPSATYAINFNAYAMVINTSASILLGKQEGERASTEDMNKFIEDVKSWQQNTGTPMIKRFLKWLLEINALNNKPTSEIIIEWPDLAEPSTAEKLEKLKQCVDIAKTAKDASVLTPFEDENEMRVLSGLAESKAFMKTEFGEDDEV